MNLGCWVVVLALVMATEPAARRAVVVTTDCGASFDDQWALTHLALCPEFDLKGIVTTHAPNLPPPAAEASARAARAVLDRLPLKARPRIEAGSSRPLESRSRPRPNPGVDLLIEQARGHAPDDRLVVLVLGAATDVASALLVDPTWADRVEIVAIGFDRWPEGGDPWNVKNDVAAWQVLLGSRAPIVVGDIAVTRRHLKMDAAQANALLSDRGEAGRSLSTLLQGWLATHGDEAAAETGDRSIVPVWDEVAVAYLLGLVETKTHPRPALRADGTFDHERPRGTITWVSTIDADRLWADLGRRLERAGRRDRPGSPAGRL